MAKQFQIDEVKTREEVETEISSFGLKVVEVFCDIFGSCKCLLQMLKFIYFELDRAEERLRYIKVEQSLIPELKDRPVTSRCLFLFYKGGKLIDAVNGVNPPLLRKLIMQYTPMVGEKETRQPPLSAEATLRLQQAKMAGEQGAPAPPLGRRNSMVVRAAADKA